MAPMSASRIAELARRLLDEGLLDNETDARLAAVHILAAADRGESADRPNQWIDPAG